MAALSPGAAILGTSDTLGHHLVTRPNPMPQLTEVPVLVDRETEQETLGDLLARASDGMPGLALVSGEVGIGKSRLVSSFAAASGLGCCAGPASRWPASPRRTRR